MTDLIQLTLKAGKGGDGKVSFRREKYVAKGGPNGGDGGRGGNIIIKASKHLASLSHLSGLTEIVSDPGGKGGTKQKSGKDAEPKVIEVPIGTVVWVVREMVKPRGWRRRGLNPLKRSQVRMEQFSVAWDDDPVNRTVQTTVQEEPIWQEAENPQPISGTNLEGEMLVELLEDDQSALVCQGGFGGRGNTHFKSSVETTPRRAERGSLGEVREVILELKLLADIGLVGFPSVGKSTLLSTLTAARPKIAAYPFTTLEPNLGIMEVGRVGGASDISGSESKSLVLADLPGLIEGASQGKGLGHQFLRHAEHCSLLGVVLSLADSVAIDQSMPVSEKVRALADQYNQLMNELSSYQNNFLDKPKLVIINKSDLMNEELQAAIHKELLKKIGEQGEQMGGSDLILVSAATGFGLKDLKQKLARLEPANI